MNRRDLLKRLPIIPAALTVLPESSLLGSDTHRGFKLWWSGWNKQINILGLVGNWVAQNTTRHRWYVYSSYPGATGKFLEGQLFNICIYENQRMPMPWHSEEQLNRFRADAFLRLIAYIDKHYEELTHEQT
jgi:hypothetical protein